MKKGDYHTQLLTGASAFNPGSVPDSEGETTWSCPSNIAIVKYWGKRPVQLPVNPSISVTLQEARTLTRVKYSYRSRQRGLSMQFLFEGKKVPEFEKRIGDFLERIRAYLPYLDHSTLVIDSRNTFPHSSGIASSASSMGSLAAALADVGRSLAGEQSPDDFHKKASFLARLGSGSAARSLFPGMVLWGYTPLWENSSDEYAVPVQGVHPEYMNLRDTILVIEQGQKKVSSSRGHALMKDHPFGKARTRQAGSNLTALKTILREGNWPAFISVMENEALTLHALMMSSSPGYILMRPQTLSVIGEIVGFRKDTGYEVGFTLDAGANVHVLYSGKHAGPVEAFIKNRLLLYCENNFYIPDRMGSGPENVML